MLIDPGFQAAGAIAFGGELVAGERAEGGLRAVAEEPSSGYQVVAGAAVDDRVGAAGIVADHAADHGSVGGGGFGAEEQPVAGDGVVQFVADHAGLDAHPAGFAVHA